MRMMIARLGPHTFGAWAALSAPAGMAGVLDFGVSTAMVAFMGKQFGMARLTSDSLVARVHWRAGVAIGSSGLFVSALASLAAFAVGYMLSPVLVGTLGFTPMITSSAVFMLRCAFFNMAATVLGGAVAAGLEAVGRSDLVSLSAAVLTIANGAVIAVSLAVRPDLIGLGLATVMTAILTILVPLAISRWCGWLSLSIAEPPSLEGARLLLSRGLALGAAGAIGTLGYPVVKWLTAAGGGAIAVSGLEIGVRAASTVSSAFGALAVPLRSHVARHGAGHRVAVDDTVRATRALARVASCGLILMAGSAPAIIELWLGESAPVGSTIAVAIVAVALSLSMMATPAYLALQGGGRGREVLAAQAGGLAAGIGSVALFGEFRAGWLIAGAISYGMAIAVGALLTLVGFAIAYGTRRLVGLLMALWAESGWLILSIGFAGLAWAAGGLWSVAISGIAWAAIAAPYLRLIKHRGRGNPQ